MVKKIIDIPTGTEKINMMFYASVDTIAIDYPNGDASVLVEDLADVSQKPVVELMSDTIKELGLLKEANAPDNLQGFINDVNDNPKLWNTVEEFNNSSRYTDDLIAEWWLGNVDFVPIKGDFVVAVDAPNSLLGWVGKDEKGTLVINYDKNGVGAQRFIEREADEIVDGLAGLNAKKVNMKEALDESSIRSLTNAKYIYGILKPSNTH